MGKEDNNIIDEQNDGFEIAENEGVGLSDFGENNYKIANNYLSKYGIKNNEQAFKYFTDLRTYSQFMADPVTDHRKIMELVNDNFSFRFIANGMVDGTIKLNGFKPDQNVNKSSQVLEALDFIQGSLYTNELREYATSLQSMGRNFTSNEFYNIDQNIYGKNFYGEIEHISNEITNEKNVVLNEIAKETTDKLNEADKIEEKEPEIIEEKVIVSPPKKAPKKEELDEDDGFEVEKNDDVVKKDDVDDGFEIEENDEPVQESYVNERNNAFVMDEDENVLAGDEVHILKESYADERNNAIVMDDNGNLLTEENDNPVQESYANERSNAFVMDENGALLAGEGGPTPIDSFKMSFGIGFEGVRGEESLKNLNARVNNLMGNTLHDAESGLRYHKVYECVNGKFADFDTIKNGINIMDGAQINYDKHNIFKRALSHFGFFNDITKERNDIQAMKDVLNNQYIDDKTINDIRTGKITELPSTTITNRENHKKQERALLNTVIKDVKIDAESQFGLKNSGNSLKSDFNKSMFEKYEYDRIISDKTNEYRKMRSEIETKYGENCTSLKGNEKLKFFAKLQEENKLETYEKEYKAYKGLHVEVNNLSTPEGKKKFIINNLKKDNMDYDKEYNHYVEKQKFDYAKNAVSEKLNDLYEKGIFNDEKEKSDYLKEVFIETPKKENPSLDNKKLGELTSMEKSNSKSQPIKTDPTKNMEIKGPNGGK